MIAAAAVTGCAAVGAAACYQERTGQSEVDVSDVADEFSDIPGDVPPNDAAPDADTGGSTDDAGADDADDGAVVPRPPLYGDCRTGSRRCDATTTYIEVCDHAGQWRKDVRCGFDHILPDAYEWNFGCQICEGVFCGFPASNPGFPDGYSMCQSDLVPESVCIPAENQLVLRQRFRGMCIRGSGSGGPDPCRDEDWDGYVESVGRYVPVEYVIHCPCESGVFRIPEIEAMPEADRPSWYPIPYNACVDTGIGRPDMWADETVRRDAEAMAPHRVGWDAVCEEPGTFDYYGFCLPVGIGYCYRDEHCGPGLRCVREDYPGYDHCEPL